jgi:hypothetical protein
MAFRAFTHSSCCLPARCTQVGAATSPTSNRRPKLSARRASELRAELHETAAVVARADRRIDELEADAARLHRAIVERDARVRELEDVAGRLTTEAAAKDQQARRPGQRRWGLRAFACRPRQWRSWHARSVWSPRNPAVCLERWARDRKQDKVDPFWHAEQDTWTLFGIRNRTRGPYLARGTGHLVLLLEAIQKHVMHRTL